MEYLTDIGLMQKAADCRIHQWAAQEGGVISQVGDVIEAQYGRKLSPRAVMLLHERICLRGEDRRLVTYTPPTLQDLRSVRLLDSVYQDVTGIEREMVDVIAAEVVARWRTAHSKIHQWAVSIEGDYIGEVMKTNFIPDGYRRLFDIALCIRCQQTEQFMNSALEMQRFYTQHLVSVPWMQQRFESAMNTIENRWRRSQRDYTFPSRAYDK